MKVISGFLKGREIKGYNIIGTRPTMDRVKESIFSIIQDKIKDSIVLDLFAGSGTYGIECISNYAKLVYFNDHNKECIKIIKNNLEKFNILEKSTITNLDYLKCLNKINQKFDLVFLDPPYKLHIISDILKLLQTNNLLNQDALVICEFQDDKLKDNYLNLVKIKEKKYGEKYVYIYKLKGFYEIK